ncbi:hypothetical protein [Noviherbaspirillum aridicola]|nr:hypothetical protein [Noviherbaspirillum aridicola]
MSHAEILIPFSLPPAELAVDLLQQLHTPALAMLAGRARPEPEVQPADTFMRSLPHERWLAARCGLPVAGDDSPPLAPLLLEAFGQSPAVGRWFVLQPVHIHIARDHLVLTDQRQLALEEADSRVLYDIAAPLFAEAGLQLAWGDALTWFLRADDWDGLRTATPDAAAGHNIDIWMPKGPHERAWRKIQNEVQMHWFGHPLNDAREARGLRPVNSLWLWGGAAAQTRAPARIFSHGINLASWHAAFRPYAGHAGSAGSAAELPRDATRTLAVLDALAHAWLSSDWGTWLAGMQALEAQWFAPLLEGVKSGQHDSLSLVLSDDTRLLQLSVTRGALRRFWRKPGLTPLLPPVS